MSKVQEVETVEITKVVWLATKPADRRRIKDGTRFIRCRQAGGGEKWVKVFWKR